MRTEAEGESARAVLAQLETAHTELANALSEYGRITYRNYLRRCLSLSEAKLQIGHTIVAGGLTATLLCGLCGNASAVIGAMGGLVIESIPTSTPTATMITHQTTAPALIPNPSPHIIEGLLPFFLLQHQAASRLLVPGLVPVTHLLDLVALSDDDGASQFLEFGPVGAGKDHARHHHAHPFQHVYPDLHAYADEDDDAHTLRYAHPAADAHTQRATGHGEMRGDMSGRDHQ